MSPGLDRGGGANEILKGIDSKGANYIKHQAARQSIFSVLASVMPWTRLESSVPKLQAGNIESLAALSRGPISLVPTTAPLLGDRTSQLNTDHARSKLPPHHLCEDMSSSLSAFHLSTSSTAFYHRLPAPG